MNSHLEVWNDKFKIYFCPDSETKKGDCSAAGAVVSYGRELRVSHLLVCCCRMVHIVKRVGRCDVIASLCPLIDYILKPYEAPNLKPCKALNQKP